MSTSSLNYIGNIAQQSKGLVEDFAEEVISKFHKNYSTLGEIDEEVVNQLKESFNEVFKSWFATEFDENMITQEFAKKTTKKRKTGSTKTRGKMKYSLMDLINNGCIKTGKWLRLKRNDIDEVITLTKDGKFEHGGNTFKSGTALIKHFGCKGRWSQMVYYQSIPLLKLFNGDVVEYGTEEHMEQMGWTKIEQPKKKAVKAPTKKAVKPPTKKAVKAPAKKTVNPPAKKAVKAPAKKVVKPTAKKVVKAPAKKVVKPNKAVKKVVKPKVEEKPAEIEEDITVEDIELEEDVNMEEEIEEITEEVADLDLEEDEPEEVEEEFVPSPMVVEEEDEEETEEDSIQEFTHADWEGVTLFIDTNSNIVFDDESNPIGKYDAESDEIVELDE
jgi:hypothetical protein